MRNQQVIKLFLVLTMSITYIMGFSHFGAYAYVSVINHNELFSKGTTIGTLTIDGKSSEEALQLSEEQLSKWLNETTITLKYKEKSQPLDVSIFNFDLENSIKQVKMGQTNFVMVQLERLEDFLSSFSTSLPLENLKVDVLESDLLATASMLEAGNYQFRLEDYLANSQESEMATLHESSIQVDNEGELGLFLGKSIEIGATSQFSLLNYIDNEIGNSSSQTLSKIATAIYEVVLPTNFTIIERHISNELPTYATLGFEAKADIELNQDLIFSNPNEFSYFIEFTEEDNGIIVSLRGPELLYQYVVTTAEKESFKPKIIRQFNPKLSPTEIKVKVEGKEGQLIKVYKEQRDEQGTVIKKEQVAEDFYPPIHQIEVQGLIVNEESTSLPPTTNGAEPATESPSSTNEAPENKDSNLDESLWGKENEIPK
ncbi:hypothetical protein EKG37_19200 [Robertmurraya yapensis]|uniref:G5 domain-containing protein n=1 Tax=Bacillus yapensis TaxID=2492960 RepID=A0A3S0KI53_9BACI|nr:VanW family protein [Bacillus yapensis]RTR27325.1 hypothetical protein EKG37_19200 [Bacillus yapensis]TKS94045.1 hypothetical protein FAR12_19205 [Bacillus yapensis]